MININKELKKELKLIADKMRVNRRMQLIEKFKWTPLFKKQWEDELYNLTNKNDWETNKINNN